LRGRVRLIKDYYEADRKRYGGMLRFMDTRWSLFLSIFETEIIEEKLTRVLGSLTFKYSRQPERLSLIPDRMTEINLRLASAIKIVDDSGSGAAEGQDAATNTIKSYKDVYDDPDRASDLRKTVGSVLDVIEKKRDEPFRGKKKRDDLATFTRQEKQTKTEPEEKYAMHKHVAISGVDVAKRPKHQLIASILYLLNFWLRKVNRRTELFLGARALAQLAEVDEEYDSVLDAMVSGVTGGYGDDAVNDVLDVVGLRRGHDSVFEAVLREKTERREKSKASRSEQLEAIKRKRRNDPDRPILELIEQEVRGPAKGGADAAHKELAQFLDSRGGKQSLTGAEHD